MMREAVPDHGLRLRVQALVAQLAYHPLAAIGNVALPHSSDLGFPFDIDPIRLACAVRVAPAGGLSDQGNGEFVCPLVKSCANRARREYSDRQLRRNSARAPISGRGIPRFPEGRCE